MKIVFLAYLHGFGGAERQIVMLANSMAVRGHVVTLVSICADNNCYKLDKNVRYIFLPDRKKNILRLLTRYQDIRRLLKNIEPDLTVSFWFQSAYMTAIMKKSITGKVLYSERGDPGDKEYMGLLGLVRTLTTHRIDGFVFQSTAAQAYFNDAIQKRSTVIPNPVFINPDDYPKPKERRNVIVNVGRLHPQKNQKVLIDAFSIIAEDIPDYKLEIFGEGSLKESLQQQIKQLDLSERVLLKGTSDHIFNLIYDAGVFVLSSDYEGIPNTLLEAMTLGIPCITTDYRPGGACDIITTGENGVIVPVGDKEQLALKMLMMVQKRDIAERMAEKAMEGMKKYSPEIIYNKWEKYFKYINR